jgi:signal transduction histidine kinase
LGIPLLGRFADVLLPSIVVLPIAIALCAAGLVQRFRRSTGIERLQVKWLATAGAVVATLYLAAMVGSLLKGLSAWDQRQPDPQWLLVIQTLAVFSFILIPISIGVAILKHGLYEIDVVINKTLVLATLAFFITAVYVAIVVGVGRLVGGGDRPNLALSVAATAVVAVLFQPVRDRVQKFANRLVYGERATPYEVLSDFADRVGGSYDAAELLPRMARTVAEGVGAARVEVWLATQGQLNLEAAWPTVASQDAGEPVGATEALRSVAELGGDRVVEVRHQGELLGALTVLKPAGESLNTAEEKLLDDVAAQAGLVLRNVRLIEDLRTSRERLVTTQDEERRRLERNLHDGAQQSLVSVALMVSTARSRLSPDLEPSLGPALDQAAEQLRLAVDELRELARGIHPAILTERGLEAAIGSLAERSPVPVQVDYRLERRPSTQVEASLYYVVAEALTNVAKYASATGVSVTVTANATPTGGTELVLEVTDDGIGGADASRGSGLRGLADRVAVVDGTVHVDSPVGGGTRLVCRVPLGSPTPVRVPSPLSVAGVS